MDQWQRNIEPNDIVSFANPEVTILYTIRSGAVDAITKTFDSVTGKTNWQFHITANEISPSTTLVFVDDFNAKDTGGPVLLNDGTSPLTQTAVTEAVAYPGGG